MKEPGYSFFQYTMGMATGLAIAVIVVVLGSNYVPAGTLDTDGYILKHGWYCISTP